MTGYQTCCLYRALKLHFTTDYDFYKYKGKIKYTVPQFHKNKHKFVYDKLATKYSEDELRLFFVANFLQNETVWVQDLLSQESYENYITFCKKKQSLSYIFKNDLLNIFSEENHKKLFKCENNDFPLLLTKMLRNEVCTETVVIMDDFMDFIPKWNKNIKDDFIWPRIKTKLLKYKPFLEYDKSKFKRTLIDTVKEFTN